MHGADPDDRLLEPGAHRRVERGERVAEGGTADPELARTDVVEALGEVPEGGGASLADVGHDRLDLRQGGLDVELGARQGGRQLAGGQGAASKIDAGDHEGDSNGIRLGAGAW